MDKLGIVSYDGVRHYRVSAYGVQYIVPWQYPYEPSDDFLRKAVDAFLQNGRYNSYDTKQFS